MRSILFSMLWGFLLALSYIIAWRAGALHQAKNMASSIDENYLGTIEIDTKADNVMNVIFEDNPINYEGKYVTFKIKIKEN